MSVDVRLLNQVLVRIISRRNFAYLGAALFFALSGYGAAIFTEKRTEALEKAMTATADLWYTYEVLLSLERGDTKSALGATALKADLFVSRIAEVEDRALTDWQREFRAKVLKDYKVFRDAHPALYALPQQIGTQERQDMLRMQREVSEFLRRATN